MINVCFFISDMHDAGGTERMTSIMSNVFVENDYNIHIISIYNKNEFPFYEINQKITCHKIFEKTPNRKKNYLRIVSYLRKFVQLNNIHFFIDVDSILSVYSIPALMLTSTKHISWDHFNFDTDNGSGFRIVGRKLSAKFSDAIITLTTSDRDKYLKSYNSCVPVYVIQNPMPTVKDIQYNEESNIILSVGRLTKVKGFDMLIEVARDVFNKYPNWKWLVLGEGEERPELEKLIKINNLERNVILKGRTEDIERYYKKASFYVSTSRTEGFPMVLLEAKSFKLPCISFNLHEGISQIIQNKVNGFLIHPFDKKKMAKQIIFLIENPETRNKFSNNALLETENYLLESIFSKWLKVINFINVDY